MDCPSSPTREMLQRSRLHFQENVSSDILQQERFHTASKKPRRSSFVLEADSKIQNINVVVLQIRKRVKAIQTDFKNLEGKANRLDVIKEQACFFMSPKRVLSTTTISRRGSPMKLTYICPTEFISERGNVSPTQVKLVEFLRRRKLVAIHLSKMCDRVDSEKKQLEEIFENNISILRFKRAEKCLIKMITLQSRIKMLRKEFEGLEERLFSEDSFDEDSSYNVSH